MQSLLLFEDELELVLNNLQLLMRPTYCYLPLHLEEPPPINDHPFQSAIVNGIDAVCMRFPAVSRSDIRRGDASMRGSSGVVEQQRHSFTFSEALPFT
jgi:hypothetical protein